MSKNSLSSDKSNLNFSNPILYKTETQLDSFAPRLLAWFVKNGRHDLPWQQFNQSIPNPYPVWISEIMLQQTQVATVIPYFNRFIAHFPTVFDLAEAHWDQVADHWAGLGYYARARNLHKTAKQIATIIEETGDFPQTLAQWQALAGIGKTTAGAIMAMGLNKFGVICDGNVKRVLTRWAGIEADIQQKQTDTLLWHLAERLTDRKRSGEYAQAIMDLGATLCTKNKPACLLCPIQEDCTANQEGRQTHYPVKQKVNQKPHKYSLAINFYDPQDQTTLWIQRPDTGIWGGLWCLPLIDLDLDHWKKLMDHSSKNSILNLTAFLQKIDQIDSNNHPAYTRSILNFLIDPQSQIQHFQINAHIKHTLTHFHWHIALISISVNYSEKKHLIQKLKQSTENTKEINFKIHSQNIDITPVFQWQNPTHPNKPLALPKAIEKLISKIK